MNVLKSTQLDFTGQRIFVGLDVHKKSWKVFIYTKHGLFKSFSQDPDPGILARYLHRQFPGAEYHTVYEAGCFGFWIQQDLQALGMNAILTHPGDVPTTDKQKKRKTDRVDANKLARELRAGNLQPIYVPSQQAILDRLLIRTRARLVANQTRTKNQIKSLLTFLGIPIPYESHQHWSGHFMGWLSTLQLPHPGTLTLATYLSTLEQCKGQLAEHTRHIRKLARDESYQKSVELLRTIPGIGPISAMVLLTEIIDITRFKNMDKLCGYVGLVPDMQASGETTKIKGLTRRANTYLKHIIIEASWIAVKKDPVLMHDFNALTKRMNKQRAIIRIARKLMARIRFVWIHQQPYVSGLIHAQPT
jgi:transposase